MPCTAGWLTIRRWTPSRSKKKKTRTTLQRSRAGRELTTTTATSTTRRVWLCPKGLGQVDRSCSATNDNAGAAEKNSTS